MKKTNLLVLLLCTSFILVSCGSKSSSNGISLFDKKSKSATPFLPILHGDPIGINMDAVDMMIYLDRPLTAADFNAKGDVEEIAFCTDEGKFRYMFDPETDFLSVRTKSIRSMRGELGTSEHFLYKDSKLVMVRIYMDGQLSSVTTLSRIDGKLDHVEVSKPQGDYFSYHMSSEIYAVEKGENQYDIHLPKDCKTFWEKPFGIACWNDSQILKYWSGSFLKATHIKGTSLHSLAWIENNRVVKAEGEFIHNKQSIKYTQSVEYDKQNRITSMQVVRMDNQDTTNVELGYSEVDEEGNWRKFEVNSGRSLIGLSDLRRDIYYKGVNYSRPSIDKSVLILLSVDGSHNSYFDYFVYDGNQIRLRQVFSDGNSKEFVLSVPVTGR
ncbi:MAG: hypothetical protein LUD46_15790 [Parabacteroides sp.]|nr:hypothetical protein [Parabacteroides sp.]